MYFKPPAIQLIDTKELLFVWLVFFLGKERKKGKCTKMGFPWILSSI